MIRREDEEKLRRKAQAILMMRRRDRTVRRGASGALGGGSREFTFIGNEADFSWFDNKIYWNGGRNFSNDYDYDALPNSITGTEVWVDNTAGGTNAGTEANPYNTNAGLATAINGSANIINVKSGTRYTVTAAFSNVARNLKIRPYGGTDPFEVSCSISTTFTVNGTHSNVYEAPNASFTSLAVGSVLDRTNVDAEGNPIGLTRQTSIANVAANANSFFYDATADIVYVRTFDDRNLQSSNVGILCMLNSTTLRVLRTSNSLAANTKLYIEGMNIFGANPFVILNTSTDFYWDFGLVNCNFSYAGQKDGCLIGGYAKGFILNSQSNYNIGDGFNYSNAVGNCFEWNCRSYYTNRVASGSNNGSTSHLAFSVIRVLGDYQFSAGKGVQDINDVKSISIGCISKNSTGTAADDRAGYASDSANPGTAEMWLIMCEGPTDANKFWNFPTSTMRIFDGGVGNLLTGTNRQDVGSTLIELTEADIFG